MNHDPHIVVRPTQPEDLPAIITLQVATLGVSFLARLGARFLDRFHRVALSHDTTLALVAVDETSGVAGFALGTTHSARFNAHLRWRVLPSLLAALLRRPALVGPVSRFPFEQGPHGAIEAELLLLAVDPARQRSGIGAALVRALETELVARGHRSYQVAVRSQLVHAQDFYARAGFVLAQRLQVFGEPMVYFTKRLDPDRPC